MTNTYSEELISLIDSQIKSGVVTFIRPALQRFTSLSKNFPVVGSSINWQLVPMSIVRDEHDVLRQEAEFKKFFFDVTRQFDPKDAMIYLCDGTVDFAIKSDVFNFGKIIEHIIVIPQHHYFIAEDFKWCLSFRMSGEMGFGFSPAFGKLK